MPVGCIILCLLLGCLLLLFGVAHVMEGIFGFAHLIKPDESSPNVSSESSAVGFFLSLVLCGMGLALLYVALSQKESGGPGEGAPPDAEGPPREGDTGPPDR